MFGPQKRGTGRESTPNLQVWRHHNLRLAYMKQDGLVISATEWTSWTNAMDIDARGFLRGLAVSVCSIALQSGCSAFLMVDSHVAMIQ